MELVDNENMKALKIRLCWRTIVSAQCLLAFIKYWMKLNKTSSSEFLCIANLRTWHWIVISGDYKIGGVANWKRDLGSHFPGLRRNFMQYNENWNIRIISIPTYKILGSGTHWGTNRRINQFNKYFGSLHTPSAWGKYFKF